MKETGSGSPYNIMHINCGDTGWINERIKKLDHEHIHLLLQLMKKENIL